MAVPWDGTRMMERCPGENRKYFYKYGGRIMYHAELVVYNNDLYIRDTKGEEDSMPCMFNLPEGVPKTAENIIAHMLETEQMIKFTNQLSFSQAAFWTSRIRIIEFTLPILPYWVNTEQMLTLSVAGGLVNGQPMQIRSFMEELTALKFLQIQEPFSFYEGLGGMRYAPISLSHVEVFVKCAQLSALMRLPNFPFGRFELTFNVSELCALTEEDLANLIPQPEIMDFRIRIDFKQHEHDENSTFDLVFITNLFPFITTCFPNLQRLMIHFTTHPADAETCFAETTRLHHWAAQINPPQRRLRIQLRFREYAEISELDILEYTAFGYELNINRELPPDTLSIYKIHPRVTVYHDLTFSDRERTIRQDFDRDTPSPFPAMDENAVTLDSLDLVPPEMEDDYNEYLANKGLMEPPAQVENADGEPVEGENPDAAPAEVENPGGGDLGVEDADGEEVNEENPDENNEATEREASPQQNEAPESAASPAEDEAGASPERNEAPKKAASSTKDEPEKVNKGARKAKDDDEDQRGPSKRAKVNKSGK